MATKPAPATNLDLAAFAVSLNDASRALYGGLWSQTGDEGGQGPGSLAKYTADLTAIQKQLTGQADAASTQILTDIGNALAAAPNTIGNAGDVVDAQAALRAAHMDILAQVANSPTLSAAGVTQVPTVQNLDPATAPHATFADIGNLFNDVVAKSFGGMNAAEAGGVNKEITAIQNDLKQLIANDPQDFHGLALVHTQAIISQLSLEKQYNNQAGATTVSARGPADTLLDIIDIVQGDDVLAALAQVNGANGWAVSPASATDTPRYQDNASQTNFWAGFVAGSNALGDAASALVGTGDKAAINALVHQLHTFEKNVTNFDAAQGGIFAGRFDNELLGAKSTLGAEVDMMIKGLRTGDKELVDAAAQQMHDNAADVAGNSIPINGGDYNTDARTIADALNMTRAPTATAFDLTSAKGAVVPTTVAVADAGGAAGGGAAGGADAGAVPGGDAGGAGAAHSHGGPRHVADAMHHFDGGHHFHHMWG